jgi:hypothetical protein
VGSSEAMPGTGNDHHLIVKSYAQCCFPV